jgi:Heme exporter protein D (CcmD)
MARQRSERMTNLPFIVGSYGIAILAALALSLNGWYRHRQARRRLAALEAEGPRRRGRKL